MSKAISAITELSHQADTARQRGMMNVPQCTRALVLLLASSPLLAAASGERNAEGVPSVNALDMISAVSVLPEMPLAMMDLSTRVSAVVLRHKDEAHLVDGPAPSVTDQLPVVGSVRRRAGDRFNTADSSHPNDFAVCYRMSPRMGLQVIPGDPTPANFKLPVSTIANNTGVTVGMTFRLDRRR